MSACSQNTNYCYGTPQACYTTDHNGDLVQGLTCDNGKSCDANAAGNACYAQCLPGNIWDCHAAFKTYHTFLS